MALESLEDLKTAVKDIENGEDIISFYVESVESEKNRGISEKRRANDEAKGLRIYKKAFETLGYESDGDLDDFVMDIQDKVEVSKSASESTEKSSEMEKQLKKLRRDFEKSQKELNTEREKAQKIKIESDRRTLSSKLTKMLEDKVYGADLLADNLIMNSRVSLEDDGTVSWINGDEKGDIDAGINNYLDSRPDLMRNKQKGGAGSSQSTEKTGKLTLADIDTMTPEQIKQNIGAVREAYGLPK